MKIFFYSLLLTIIAGLLPLTLEAQPQKRLTDSVTAIFEKEDYNRIANWIKHLDPDTLNPTILYYTGLSFYILENDSMAVDYLQRSIAGNPYYPPPYYYIGLIYSMNSLYDKSIIYLKASLKLSPHNSDYLESLGDVYAKTGEADSSLLQYYRLTDLPGAKAGIYLKMADLYLNKKNRDKALNLYYDCLYKADERSERYGDCLYNIGHFEFELGNFAEADILLTALTQKDPDDTQALEKLIQVTTSKQEWLRAGFLAELLYKKHGQGKTPENSREFIFHQYHHKEGQVVYYEKFENPDSIYNYKHAIYGMDKEGEIIFTLLTKSINSNEPLNLLEWKYITDEKTLSYSDENFSIYNTNYKKLVSTAKKIMSGKIKPDDGDAKND